MNKKFIDIYADYLISQTQHATGLSTLLDGDLSHDQVTRFLHRDELTSKELWQYVKCDFFFEKNSKRPNIIF